MIRQSPASRGPQVDVIRATWLRQAGFLIEGCSAAIVIDPFLDDLPGLLVSPAKSPEQIADVDVVIATHEHGDHMDLATWRRISVASTRPVFIVPEPLVDDVVASGIPSDRVAGAAADRTITVNGISITPVPARHGVEVGDAYDFGLERSGGRHRYLGYVVTIDGVVLYHAGDTIMYDGMEAYLAEMGIDAAFLPINGRDFHRERRGIVGNLHPRESADLAAAIGAHVLIPMHIGTAPDNTESAAVLVDYVTRIHPGLSVLIPGHGATFCLAPSAQS